MSNCSYVFISEEGIRMDENFVVETDCSTSGCSHGHSHQEDSNNKYFLLLMTSGIIALLAAVLLKDINHNFRLFLFFLSYILTGGDVVLKAIKNISRGKIFDENFLMVIATLGAFLIGEYPEATSVMIFYKIGEAFQDKAIDKSKGSIEALMNIKPEYANILTNGEEIKISPDLVNIGDIIIIKPGEKIPLDGIIINGSSFLDTSALTGESVLREVFEGDEVLSGSVNVGGLLKIETSKSFGESAVNKIIELVQNAGSKKAETEKFITKFARYYTPAVVIFASLMAFIPPLLIPGAGLYEWGYKALVFLVISCPCALVISIPLGFFGGIGAASKQGILVKGGNYLEALNYVDTVIFDKTGTLTKGIFTVVDVYPEKRFSSDEVLRYAALAESFSTHPIARSIVESYSKDVDKESIIDYQEIAGQGVRVVAEDKVIHLGNEKLGEIQILGKKQNRDKGNEKKGYLSVYLWINTDFAGEIILSDVIKEDSFAAIENLKKSGIKNIIMLTGDEKKTADRVAHDLGISLVYAQLLPQEKLEKLEEILQNKKKNQKVVFLGDGINDAPVLARADIGIAMGGLGSDAAVEAADIVFMNDSPGSLLTAMKVARQTKKIVWQNIVMALGVKLIIMIMGVAGLAGMWEAIFADVGVALLAILNSVRILK